MRFSLLNRAVDFLSKKRHGFYIKSKDINSDDIVNTINSKENITIDIYSNCQELFLNLNKYKKYYEFGIINDKQNPANIFINLIESINPDIKMMTYKDKNTFIQNLFV